MRYVGMAIGEHLGYFFTAAWTLLIALVIRRAAFFGAWQGWLGVELAVGIAAGLLEPAGVAGTEAINALSYILWSLWLVMLGVNLLCAPSIPYYARRTTDGLQQDDPTTHSA
jgi:hypothetical protein